MDSKKLESVADWPVPKNPTNVWQFLVKIAQPLLDLTKKTIFWHWGKEQFKAFEKLQYILDAALTGGIKQLVNTASIGSLVAMANLWKEITITEKCESFF